MVALQERPNNMFLATVPAIAAISNLLLLAFARQYITNDLVSLVAAVYAYASVPLCAYGLVGVTMRKPKFIAVFANFLFLDAVVWALCRFLVTQLFFISIDADDVCSVYNPRWSPENFHHDIVTSVRRFQDARIGHLALRKRCQVQSGAFQIVVVFLLLALAAAHGSIAMKMRRYSKEVEKSSQLPECHTESEKPALMVSTERDLV
ncbi:uncharacterized protein RCC_11292 [Ramularia collo-cygni]|uniref:MARVEL domain-containing protein n=1 Tax=Ramularia collo-cygni TaxID=112498 RepID=A0A2D3VNJ0_9PEZI|nr:uncharacterized protein RCC_11292 [Ramularia collo-cygni]CZT25624.1 uncharacterized protein RCC_11292 [Ramularia collo-cygni]